MVLTRGIVGEDIPLTISYEDSNGDPVDPDDQDSDGTPDADVTIRDEDGTELVTSQAMTHNETGDFEYVWDTSVDADGSGTYEVDVVAEFNGETKITRNEIQLR